LLKAGVVPTLGEFHRGALAMKGICFECGTPLRSKKCYYCGKVKKKSLSKEELLFRQRYDGIGVMPERWFKAITISGTIAAVIIGVGFLLYHTNNSVPSESNLVSPASNSALTTTSTTSEYRYVCSPSPMDSDITAVTIIEASGATIVRWIEEQTFTRKDFIENYMYETENVPNYEIIAFFYLVNILEDFMEGTHWELVSADENYIIAHHIFDYENMSRSDLDQLWEPNYLGVTRHTAITFLESQGATCVRE